MLTLDVLMGDAKSTLSFSRHTLGLGRDLPGLNVGSDILPSPRLLPKHVELFEQEGRLRYVANGPVFVEGQLPNPPPPRDRRELKHWESDRPRGHALGVGGSIALLSSSAEPGLVATVTLVHMSPIVPADYPSSEADFLHVVEATPGAISPRLVYADMLEEHGYLTRAEFLRLQVRLALRQDIEGDREAHKRYLKNLLPAKSWVGRIGSPRIARQCPIQIGRECPTAWGARETPSHCTRCDHAVSHPAAS